MNPAERVLDRAINEMDMKNAEFCRLIGELPQTVNSWRKRGTVPAEKLIRVSKAIGKSTDWILTGQQTPVADSDMLTSHIGEYLLVCKRVNACPIRNLDAYDFESGGFHTDAGLLGSWD